ncbi:PREDICTED: evolutionarily conserved signaling intermediate in Toll pathway, mitochondrial-like isoform X2 [Priapulus caudatus]|uniref:Evolutionarily conserved signaling intermediate in Toll pathway, mitochondrial n=1 Tax=Priapulus caudatus TaxID=37621 RepID=A0ABM1ENM6_PRICU|nr:PREDICTED: evolutionarily conserved signaling intermediate in Toll pathway, mitochondrial-like isoform X1 [Priapulus caudatus]XP_014673797.1 PREDICTED: evolutionarily conserved signaling intermediate in Toll pathway, mitochondrial-like isoform X2 [Priapulus caudatus]
MFQAGFIHYPKQQECAVDILQHMEDNGVCPDDEMGRMLHARFGGDGHPVRKFQRMLYWMPKFKHISPFPLPRALPDDPADLAVLALRRIAVDAENKIDVYREDDLPDSAVDRTFVVTAQAPEQMRLIARHPTDVPVFVEGAFKLWLRNKWVHYFVLKADPKEEDATRRKRTQEEEDAEDPSDWQLFFEETTRRQETAAALVAAATVHEQEDGCVLALCVTGTNSRDSLASWLKLLQRDNPALAAIPVVFRLRSAAAELQTVDDASSQHPASVVEATT